PTAARKALEEAHELAPGEIAPLVALIELYLAAQDWPRLVAALGRAAEASSDGAFRSMARHAAGLFAEVLLQNSNAARASYALPLADDAQNIAATMSASALALRQEDFPGLVRLLSAEAGLVDEPRTVQRLCERAGDVHWERLGDADGAAQAYRRAAHAMP